MDFIINKLLRTLSVDDTYQFMLNNHYDMVLSYHYNIMFYCAMFGVFMLIPFALLVIAGIYLLKCGWEESAGFCGGISVILAAISCGAFTLSLWCYHTDHKEWLKRDIEIQYKKVVEARLLLEG